jgi:predicted dinucleotide-binding enzyme
MVVGMKIGIIGAGNVGGTLGKRWAAGGHHVILGTRETIAETAAATEVVVLATPWPAAQEAVQAMGDLQGKILIDATNPLLPNLAGLDMGPHSGGEQVAGWATNARVVKAFNTVGYNIMADNTFAEGKVALFYCGDDAEAKKSVAALISELGFDALDAGPLAQCRVLEPLAMLWISLAVKYGYGRDFALHLMRRPDRA